MEGLDRRWLFIDIVRERMFGDLQHTLQGAVSVEIERTHPPGYDTNGLIPKPAIRDLSCR